MRELTFLLFSCCLVALPVLAQAPNQEGGGGRRGGFNFMRMNPVMAALDADHDGVVTAGEWAKAPEVLRSLDRDGDGTLTAIELRPAMFGRGGRGREGEGQHEHEGGGARPANDSARVVDTYMAFDKNGDGVLTKDELPERMQGLLARGDANQDGKLTREELTKLAGAAASSGGGERRSADGPPPDPIFTALDTDHDGKVSPAEIAQAAAALAKLDKNQDGRLTEDEVRPAFGGPRGPGFGGPRP